MDTRSIPSPAATYPVINPAGSGLRKSCLCGWAGDSGQCEHKITGEHCPACHEPINPGPIFESQWLK